MDSTRSHEFHPHTRPYYPWVIWSLSTFFIFYIFLVQYSGMSIHNTLNTGPKNVFVFFVILFQIPIALILDRFGARKITTIAMVTYGLGAIVFGYVTSELQLLAATFVLGIGWCVAFITTIKLAFHWFIPKRFALMAAPWITYTALWHIPFFKTAYRMSESAASTITAINLLIFAIGCPIMGALSTKIGKRKLLLWISIPITIICSSLTIYVTTLPLPIVALLSSIAAFAASSIALIYPLVIEKNLPSVTATVVGFVLAVHFFFQFLFDLFLRMMTGHKAIETLTTQEFQLGFTLLPAFLLLSLALLALIKETHAKQTYE